MSEKCFEAKIYTKAGGASVTVRVNANDSNQARKLIEMKPEFKSWMVLPKEVR